jgi:RNA polymerase sigma-70 factor (ECF subfamily)
MTDLVNRALDGDRGAFDQLLGPVVGIGFRMAYGMLHDTQAAEDAVQEAAIRAWQKLDHLRPGTEMRPWFLGIVRNQCRTTARGRWWSVLRLDEVRGATLADPEDEAVRGADVRSALRRLAAKHREVLVLHYYLDLSLEEIAVIVGVPVGTVKSRINRGVAAMRPFFKPGEALA